MNDTKDIQTIKEALNEGTFDLPIHSLDLRIFAENALSRIEARLSAHQELISALEATILYGVFTSIGVVDQARAALARAKEGQ